jgi:Base plate wedge protein 53
MPYFTYFPSISYINDPTDFTKVITVKDITVRAKINEYFKNSALTSLPYEIQDGERPETLSHRIYDRTDLHWTILMFNEIHDPIFEWPLSSAELESKLQAKYKGYALYYPDSARIPNTFQLQDTTVLKGATTISQILTDGTTITASIINWDPTYNCIVIGGEQASLFDSTVNSPLSTDDFARIYIDGDTSKLFAFSKIVPHEYGVNHFEDSDGNVLDPRNGPPSEPSNTSSVLNRYVSGIEFVETLAINNRTQEFKDNDKKRSIRVIKPDFMSSIVTQFRSLFE